MMFGMSPMMIGEVLDTRVPRSHPVQPETQTVSKPEPSRRHRKPRRCRRLAQCPHVPPLLSCCPSAKRNRCLQREANPILSGKPRRVPSRTFWSMPQLRPKPGSRSRRAGSGQNHFHKPVLTLRQRHRPPLRFRLDLALIGRLRSGRCLRPFVDPNERLPSCLDVTGKRIR